MLIFYGWITWYPNGCRKLETSCSNRSDPNKKPIRCLTQLDSNIGYGYPRVGLHSNPNLDEMGKHTIFQLFIEHLQILFTICTTH